MSDEGKRGQYHFSPESYGEIIAEELPAYGELHEAVGHAVAGVRGPVRRLLDLGVGTGETTLAALGALPGDTPEIVGVDVSKEMLAVAAERLPQGATLLVRGLEDELPPGPFELVVSALAVHHLDGAGKQDLFRRLADVMPAGALLVLADVVVPDRPVSRPTPLSPDYDMPDRVDDQLRWLEEAGFAARIGWQKDDLVMLVAVRDS